MYVAKISRCRATAAVLLLAVMIPVAAATTAFPAGDYSAGSTVLHFGGDGSMQVKSGDKVLLDARYESHADRIRFTDTRGQIMCPKGQESGEYRWQQTGDKVVFVKLDDRCEGRMHDLTGQPWTKK